MAKRGRTYSSGGYRKKRKTTYKKKGRVAKWKRGYRSRKPKGFKKWQTKARWTGIDFPQVLQKKFNWTQTMDLAPSNSGGVNGSDYKVVRLGSIYDPDYQVGGNSVNYFTTFLNASLFLRYQVMGAKVTMDLVNPTTQMVSVYNFLADSHNLSNFAMSMSQQDLDDNARTPSARDILYIGPADGGKNQKKVSFYVKPWEVQGKTRAQYLADETYWGQYNNSPADGTYLVMQAICTLPNTGALLRNLLNITFYVRLFENQNSTALSTADGDADKPGGESMMLKSDGTEITPEEKEALEID